MNPFSINKNILNKKSKGELVKDIVVKDEVVSDHEVKPKPNKLVKKGYDSAILTSLNSDEILFSGRVVLCIYKINEPGYLQYLLYKYKEKQELVWLFHDIKGEKLIEASETYLKTYVSENVNVKGYLPIQNKNVVYLFCQVESKISNHSDLLWCSVDEIVNLKSNMDYNVSRLVTQKFLTNPGMNYVFEGFNRQLEVPSVLYYVAEKDKLDYIFNVGLPFMYSDEYGTRVCEMITYDEVKERLRKDETLGFIKFIVFLNNTISVVHPEEYMNVKDELKTKKYNSIFIGKMNENKHVKFFILKNEQAIPLLLSTVECQM